MAESRSLIIAIYVATSLICLAMTGDFGAWIATGVAFANAAVWLGVLHAND
jgi:hypothetical protein